MIMLPSEQTQKEVMFCVFSFMGICHDSPQV